MIIKLSPIASTHTTQVSVDGLTLTVDGQVIDLSVIPIGGEAEAEDDSPLQGKITREQVTVKYHYDMELAEDDQSTDWNDYTFIDPKGVVPSPIKWKEAK